MNIKYTFGKRTNEELLLSNQSYLNCKHDHVCARVCGPTGNLRISVDDLRNTVH